MDATQKILELVGKSKDGVTASSLEKELGFSRQYTVRLLNRLIAQGEIHKRGKTRAARYFPGKAGNEIDRLNLVKERQGLSEYTVFEEVKKRMRLNARLNRNCRTGKRKFPGLTSRTSLPPIWIMIISRAARNMLSSSMQLHLT